MNQKRIENMIRRAEARLGETQYADWRLTFIEDALKRSIPYNQILY